MPLLSCFSVRLSRQNSLEQWQACLNISAFYRSLNTHFYLHLISKVLFLYITPFYKFSTIYLLLSLDTLYTQSCWITLVAQVLPRLLAPVFATTSFCTYQHNSRTWSNFTTTIVFFISVKLIGHTFVHCLIFFTAAIRWGGFHTPCGWFFSQIN